MEPQVARRRLERFRRALREDKGDLTDEEEAELVDSIVETTGEVLIGIWEELREANGKTDRSPKPRSVKRG
jgi:hypothetical protein